MQLDYSFWCQMHQLFRCDVLSELEPLTLMCSFLAASGSHLALALPVLTRGVSWKMFAIPLFSIKNCSVECRISLPIHIFHTTGSALSCCSWEMTVTASFAASTRTHCLACRNVVRGNRLWSTCAIVTNVINNK